MFTPFSLFSPPNGGGGDADADAYIAEVIAQGGSLTAGDETKIQTLFTDLKAAGLYTKIKAFYPMMGGVLNSVYVDGKLTSTLATNLGTPVASATNGLITGGANNVKPPFNSSNVGTQNNASFGCYITQDNNNGNTMFM